MITCSGSWKMKSNIFWWNKNQFVRSWKLVILLTRLTKIPQIFSNDSSWNAHWWFGLHLDLVIKLMNVLFSCDRTNALSYQELFENNLLPFTEAIRGFFWMFQEDCESIHTTNSIWEMYLNNSVHVMSWLSVCINLKTMDNAWSLLVRVVYLNTKKNTPRFEN